ncbi:hypothetical protein J2Z21_002750 [Streptomyces griseochromogenes]|uniref:DUF4235 domain-containing protein n=1 Tax=Streptomyces griseochromogenes TaxID=68214 RepID=A0ABS4LQX4_9ACTN|nr:hypothetical protein [Streptomyces griseochromogenes]
MSQTSTAFPTCSRGSAEGSSRAGARDAYSSATARVAATALVALIVKAVIGSRRDDADDIRRRSEECGCRS